METCNMYVLEASVQLSAEFNYSGETQARNLFYRYKENICSQKLSIEG